MIINHTFYFICFIIFYLTIKYSNSLMVEDDVKRNVTELIKSKGFDCLNFEVTTSDGFIISLQRIQKKKSPSVENKIHDFELLKLLKSNNLSNSRRIKYFINKFFHTMVRQLNNSEKIASFKSAFKDLYKRKNAFKSHSDIDVDKLFNSKNYNEIQRSISINNKFLNQNYDIKRKDDDVILMSQDIVGDKVLKADVNVKPVVYLQHGLLDSATTWVINEVDQSLGFVLAEHGFDVWLGNSRGNMYSRKHTKYSPDQAEFWDFSYDDMALLDLPAIIEFIVNTTSVDQIDYIGHSQGGLIGLVGLSENKYLANKIRNFIGLAPAAYVDQVVGVGRFLMENLEVPETIFKIFGIHEFLPNKEQLYILLARFCDQYVLRDACKNIIFLISGYNEPEMNVTRIPVYVAHTPAGTSVKNMVHYSQVFKSKQFRKFDYGKTENEIRYNQSDPPQFNLSNIKTPVHIFAGGKDYLADPQDMKKLIKDLKTLKTFKTYSSWAHLDFVWGYRPKNMIKDILHIIKKF